MSEIKDSDQYPIEFETEIGLEMVAIPGGKFMMGSPESEHERSTDEGPQHSVTIQPFFMGRYPVTEAQWYAIANTLPVEQELDPERAAGFEADNLPITNLPRLMLSCQMPLVYPTCMETSRNGASIVGMVTIETHPLMAVLGSWAVMIMS